MNNIDHNDCFARFEMPNGTIECTALIKVNYKKCKFYRNDIQREDIERDIKYRYSTRSIKNEY